MTLINEVFVRDLGASRYFVIPWTGANNTCANADDAVNCIELALHGLPDSYFQEFVPRVEAVTLEDVTRVAAQYLDPARMVTLAVGDHDRIAPTLMALNLGEPFVMSA